MTEDKSPAAREDSPPAPRDPIALPGTTEQPRKRTLLRVVLMVVLPVLAIVGGLSIYYAGGRYVTSENAYVKAPIISVVSQVSGRVEKVHVGENQFVSRGDVLLELERHEFELAVAEAEADLASVGQDVENLRAELRRARAEIAVVLERKRFLEGEYVRTKELADKGLGLGTKLAESRHLMLAAERNLTAAKEREAGIVASLSGAAEGGTERHPKHLAAAARLKRANLDLDRTTLRASADGYIIKMTLQPGEFVEKGDAVFAVVDTANAFVEANLKETELTHIRPGQKATFVAEAYPDVSWTATVIGISPATGAEFAVLPPQNASGNWVKVVQRLPVRFEIDDTNREAKPPLRAGLSVKVSIDTGHKRTAPPIISQVLAATRTIVGTDSGK